MEAWPDDGWVGEETGSAEGSTGRRWIVDPIDGTRNFVRGVPLWATLVACEADTPDGPQVIASAVLIPGLGERYDAIRGGGARCDGKTIQVSPVTSLDEALFCFETPSWFRVNGLSGLFTEMEERCGLSRGLGDAYGHMLVASGRAEIAIEPQLALWDVAATSLVVEEAGGRFSDLVGTSPGLRSGNALVSNGALHDEVLNCIARHRG
jgi:histidinol-phosphatase